MQRIRLLGACSALALVAAVVPSAASARPVATSSAKPVITISGSTSVAPLTIRLAKAYVKAKRKRVKFKIAQGGSDIGVADVAAGRVSIGASSRDPKGSDPGGLVFNKIARDAICLITNSGNRIANLSQAQVQAIFSGQVRDWSNVPGATARGPIDIIVRTAASGTQDAFQKIFLGSAKVSTTAAAKASNGLIQQAVRSDPNGIGYVSLDFTSGTSAAAYQGVACTLQNAKSGQYGGTRNFWMVTRGAPTGAAAKFINWVQNSTKAARIVSKGWVPLK